MLAVLSRYKLIFIIMALIILILMTWLFIRNQESEKAPSRVVFVLKRIAGPDKLEGGI